MFLISPPGTPVIEQAIFPSLRATMRLIITSLMRLICLLKVLLRSPKRTNIGVCTPCIAISEIETFSMIPPSTDSNAIPATTVLCLVPIHG